MAILNPPGMSQLNSILGLTTGTSQDLINQHDPGAASVRSTMGQIGRGPQMALPGGGAFSPGGGPFGQSLETETPAATLPILQSETARKQGLAGTQAGAGQLQTGQNQLNLSYQQVIQQELEKLMASLGMPSLQAGAVGGGYNILNQLLGI